MDSCGPLHMDRQRLADQLEPIYNSSVPIQDVAGKTCRERWTIDTGSERVSWISVLAVWHDDKVLRYITNTSIKNQSFVCTQFKYQTVLFDPFRRLCHVLPLRTRVDLEARQWMDTPYSLKLQHYWSLTIRLCNISGHSLKGRSYLSAEMQFVYSAAPACQSTLLGRDGDYKGYYMLFWTSPGSSNPQSRSCMITYVPSRKAYKQDKQVRPYFTSCV